MDALASPIPATSGASPPALPLLSGATIDKTYGAVLLGTFFALTLYGVVLPQTLTYFRVRSADSPWTNYYVCLILLLDTMYSVVSVALCYVALVLHYSDASYVIVMDWPLQISDAISGANIVACQSFFTYRVYKIGKRTRPIVYLCLACEIAGLGLCIVGTIEGFRNRLFFPDFNSRFNAFVAVPTGLAVLVDTILALVLIHFLHSHRTSIPSTNSLLDTLIAYAVTTGLLTDVFNILTFVFVLSSSPNLYFVALNMIATKVYTTSVMAALNLRRPHGLRRPGMSWDARSDHISLTEIPQYRNDIASVKGSSATAGTNTPSSRHSVIHIKVETEFVKTLDSDEQVHVGGDLGPEATGETESR